MAKAEIHRSFSLLRKQSKVSCFSCSARVEDKSQGWGREMTVGKAGLVQSIVYFNDIEHKSQWDFAWLEIKDLELCVNVFCHPLFFSFSFQAYALNSISFKWSRNVNCQLDTRDFPFCAKQHLHLSLDSHSLCRILHTLLPTSHRRILQR